MANISNEVKNEVLRNMRKELDRRNYTYFEDALEKILDTWAKRKNNLLDLLSKHPLWNPERLLIQFDADYTRPICTEEVYKFTSWLKSQVNGCRNYYLPWNNQSKEVYICEFIENISNQFFDESMKDNIDYINTLNENFRLRTNMKSSKAIGKICRDMGWDKLEGYNKRYAALCDCLNPIQVKRHTCISLNPIDFLLMSYGTSWDSCHYIGEDYDNDDAGCYSSGTISYMLDEHSFVFYTVESSYDGNYIEGEPKVQREIFGYNDEVLVQSRLYPQSNDSGAAHIYTEIREIVQKVVADCLGKPNLWINSHSDVDSVIKHGDYATCYPDWNYFSTCNVSTLKERENGKENRKVILGARPICIKCGCLHENTENIVCDDCQRDGYYCYSCGDWVDEDDARYCAEDGHYYCSDCVTWCEQCEEYYPNDDVYCVDGYDICIHCIERSSDIYKCDDCGEYHYEDNMVFVGDHCYCEDCVEDNVFTCEECGAIYENNCINYDEETDKYYCDECYEKLLAEREEADNVEDADELVKVS